MRGRGRTTSTSDKWEPKEKRSAQVMQIKASEQIMKSLEDEDLPEKEEDNSVECASSVECKGTGLMGVRRT